MNIQGLQKLTLLDFPKHTACIVFFAGCNMRCPFCHNYGLARSSSFPVCSDEELFGFLSKRTGLLDGVVITGGEPLLLSELPELLRQIKKLGFLVKLDTNGLLPDALERLLKGGFVDYIAMDVKNSPEKYAITAGLETVDLSLIKQSIGLIMDKAPDYEFRTTVMRKIHDEQDMNRIGEMIQGADHYYIQNFQNSNQVPNRRLSSHTPQTLKSFRKIMLNYVKHVTIRGIE